MAQQESNQARGDARLQRALLFELLEPPYTGRTLDALAARLGEPVPDVELAGIGLAGKGLATREGDGFAATRPVLELDKLHPLAL